jgi:hypothetical protein
MELYNKGSTSSLQPRTAFSTDKDKQGIYSTKLTLSEAIKVHLLSLLISYQTNTLKNTMRSTSILATILLSATLVSVQSNNRGSCSTGNNGDCFRDCFEPGFPGRPLLPKH